ncbi:MULTISPECIES: ABC transporter substrate-binding protein [unclassified Micromonospora]|uniref:ABC transporter substrate-binding protein n=1 Tax=unclassified Micromonospora TaxID=2617518 RepID=UPI0010345BE1|nr:MULTISPECIES: extracellular solute-binding protein [unclassified Micromonospora]QKW11515.1 extracellular solute-binding protein [Verrucosispora sp. NA02020]QKW11639.1 extracellular solute-binding protein [Verrucosispora sp. NA02020]TBL43261.1 extracellular solute-binding protein [Verrucosispora sp. SN26_14.1]
MSVPQYRKAAALALVAGLSLTACSTKSGDTSDDASGKVTITVDCQPVGAQKELLQNWNEDVAEFQRQNPDIVVKSVSVGEQCNNPPDFTARLAGGTVTDVFYGYMTDLQQVLDSGQAMDITEYATAETVPTWDSVDPALKEVFTDGGRLYAVPVKNYSMGLVYNKVLFQQAGLDVNNPPKTWGEVREAARKISALGSGIAGYAEYSAGNTGGWHFTALLYSQGGQVLTEDGGKAAFNSPQGRQVLQNLKDMRYGDDSMGDRQLLQWGDLLTNAGAGKVGMFVGAPDTTQAIVSQFQGKFEDWAMAPLPGQDGRASGTLGGGEGYFFKKDLTPEQVEAGLKWIAYQKLTPGKGQLDYARAKPQNYPVGLPQPLLFSNGSDAQKQELDLRKANANVDTANFALFEANPVPIKGEPRNAQAIYAVLDAAMSGVLTNRNADIDALLKTAEEKVNQLLAAQG